MPIIKISLALSCIRCKYVAFKGEGGGGGSLHSKISKTLLVSTFLHFQDFGWVFGDLNFRWVFNNLKFRALFFSF